MTGGTVSLGRRLRHLVTLRFAATSVTGMLLALLLLGLPTAIVPNPLFARMTPTEGFNIAVWLASAPLLGLILATYVAPPRTLHAAAAEGGTGLPTTAGGLAAFLAIGCPVCNKLVVAALGVSGALTVFAPLQPLIGAASVGLLAATLGWRVRQLTAGCPSCVS